MANVSDDALSEHYAQLLAQSDLSNRVVVIYGAGSGDRIACHVAQQLSKHGAQLILLDLIQHQSKSLQLAKKCDQVAKHGTKWHMVGQHGKWQPVQRCWCFTVQSPTDHGSLKQMLDTVHDQFQRIDSLVIVNVQHSNTEQNDSLTGPGHQHLLSNLSTKISHQLLMFVHLIRVILPSLQRTNGQIVNLSSICAIQANAHRLSSCATENAIDMLVKCLSLELGPNHRVRINSVNYVSSSHHTSTPPSMAGFEVNQQMVDRFLERVWQPGSNIMGHGAIGHDVAMSVIHLLCNNRSPFLNGMNIVVHYGPDLSITH